VIFASLMAPSAIGAPLSGRLTPAGAQRLGIVVFIAGQLARLVGLSEIAVGYGALAAAACLITLAATAGKGRNPASPADGHCVSE
jgi:hypothetical protein